MPRYKPQILDHIYLDEEIVGYVMGNNLKEIDFFCENEIGTFIENVHKLELNNLSKLYIEGCDSFNSEILSQIKKAGKYSILTGDNIRIKNLGLLLERISKLLNRQVYKNDLLIVCDDKARLLEIIKTLPKELNCIASLGILEDDLYEDILKETGVSIYEPRRMEKAIKNFNIIINFSERTLLDISNIRNQGLVIDYSSNKTLQEVTKLNKSIVYIEDLYFPSKLNSKWIEKFISSRLYETIYPGKIEEFGKIYSQASHFYLDEYINSKIKIRGRL